MRFTFQYLSGAKAGQELTRVGTILRLGRDPVCEVPFDPMGDDAVSAVHAQLLVMDDGRVQVMDMGSSNGTTLNGQSVGNSPLPILSGAVVRLGENGPKVAILYQPSGPVARTVMTRTAGGGGKKVLLLVLILVYALGAVGGFYLLSGSEGESSQGEGSAGNKGGGAEGDSEDPEIASGDGDGDVEEEGPKEDASSEADTGGEPDNPWASLGLGTILETMSTTNMEVAGNKIESESTTRYELKEITDDEVVLEMESIASGFTSTNEVRFPRRPELTGEPPEEIQYDEEKEAEVVVPAGSFSCTYRKYTQTYSGAESVIETWSDEELPIPYKSISSSETSTTVTELTRMEKK